MEPGGRSAWMKHARIDARTAVQTSSLKKTRLAASGPERFLGAEPEDLRAGAGKDVT